MNVWTLKCAQAGCDEAASHVAVQAHELAMLFRHGAGVVCMKHARQAELLDALCVSLADYADLAARTTAP